MGKYSFMFYYDWEPYLKMLPDDAARGRMLMAILEYASQGKTFSSDDPVEQMLFAFCKNAIDRDQAKYEQRCRQNTENINKRWHGQENTNVYERIPTNIRSNTNNTDMDMDMEKDIDRISPSRALNEPVGEAKKKVIYTR